jgi:hypothetical protein
MNATQIGRFAFEGRMQARGLQLALAKRLPRREVQYLLRCPAGFPWDHRADWGIEEAAWTRAAEWKIDPLLLFCHPRVISEQPRLLLYYRTIALLSQKGFQSLVRGSVARIESGSVESLDSAKAVELATTINSILSAVVTAGAEIEPFQLAGLQFAAAGATIQGSWNNAVGAEGERAVRTILANHLRSEIVQVVFKDATVDYTPALHTELLDRIADVRVLRLTRGFHLRFSSEPDVSLRDANDLPVVAVEVKAGNDSAGALERLGASMKSFENDRAENPRLKTICVIRCMTPELRRRIDEANPFDYTFGLSELMADDRKQRTFANLIVSAVVGRRTR